MSHLSAVLLVLLAGTMWAASGTAAQHFYTQSAHVPIELTQVRLFLSSTLFLQECCQLSFFYSLMEAA